jgi:hypothetical protein
VTRMLTLLPGRGGQELSPAHRDSVNVRYMDLDTVQVIAWRKGATRRVTLARAISGTPEELSLYRAALLWLRAVTEPQRMGVWVKPGPWVAPSAEDKRAIRSTGRPG